MCHYAATNENMAFLRALVGRGVDFNGRCDEDYTPLAMAIRMCRIPVVSFLLEQFRARGREAEDVIRELVERPPLTPKGHRFPLIFCAVQQTPLKMIPEFGRVIV